MIKYVLSMRKTLGSIPSNDKKEEALFVLGPNG